MNGSLFLWGIDVILAKPGPFILLLAHQILALNAVRASVSM
jgi:hypothetical protein